MKNTYFVLCGLIGLALAPKAIHAVEIKKSKQEIDQSALYVHQNTQPALYVHNDTEWPIKVTYTLSSLQAIRQEDIDLIKKTTRPEKMMVINRIIPAGDTLEIAPVAAIEKVEYQAFGSMAKNLLPEYFTNYSIDLNELKKHSSDYSSDEVVEITATKLNLFFKSTWLIQNPKASEELIKSYYTKALLCYAREKQGAPGKFLWPHQILGLTENPTTHEIIAARDLYIRRSTKENSITWPTYFAKIFPNFDQETVTALDTMNKIGELLASFQTTRTYFNEFKNNNEAFKQALAIEFKLVRLGEELAQSIKDSLQKMTLIEKIITNYTTAIEQYIKDNNPDLYSIIQKSSTDPKNKRIVWFLHKENQELVIETISKLVLEYKYHSNFIQSYFERWEKIKS